MTTMEDDDAVVVVVASPAHDDDVIPNVAEQILTSQVPPWFQRPAPSVWITFGLAAVAFLLALRLYVQRVRSLHAKFGSAHFTGSLRTCALVSAYMDNYGYPRFATLKLCCKSLVFLGFLQRNFHRGFWIMWAILVVESSLDTMRVLLAYRNCSSLHKVSAVSDEEANYMKSTTTLTSTNVYEDFSRPLSIAIMVFLVQGMLIGLVMDDTYQTTHRTCFNGNGSDASCPMLTSLGSYALYCMGTFMACVFYVGPRNSYGQKEQNPTFWLKVFLMAKEAGSGNRNGGSMTLTWTDSTTDQTHTLTLAAPFDARIWTRFVLSFLVNGVGFHFLLHVLPIQVAGQSTIIGVVFRAIGMIYLADLDDSTAETLTLVSSTSDVEATKDQQQKENASTYGSNGNDKEASSVHDLERAKDEIVQTALADVEQKLNALARGEKSLAFSRQKKPRVTSITNALFLSATTARRKKDDAAASGSEEDSLLV